MVGVVALILGMVLLRWAPPTVRGEDAPPDIFAAGRAMTVLWRHVDL
ncbi:MAG TPA: hypothetical protein VLC95_04840 [Anaerolineae bacterium]|nr:hypothetical protein [Anaerolineae bacterium]